MRDSAGPKRTTYRLRKDVRPTDVDLHVEVDPTRGDAYQGTVRHQLRLKRKRNSIELHADDMRVSKPRLEVAGKLRRGKIVKHPERETVEIIFAQPIPAGEATLELSFRSKLRTDLRGLYSARDGKRRYAFTQLEATDARRFFPCFDEPSFKACFRLSVTTGKKNAVVSNSPVEREERAPDQGKTLHFERTPLLSTYLLALAVGDLVASKPVRCGKTEIRTWHVPGKEKLTAFGLECAKQTLGRLERYFDIPYPYAKLDLVAAPDFEAGAMENAGAVFFRETLLLSDPATLTFDEKKRVAEVICHELAHMWYGDLVTMAWWDDLWLNEAFATWMAFQVVDDWQPEWHMWSDFQHYKAMAFGLDALDETHPIYTRVRSPEEATENFDAITYEKGAGVVRMIERYLGADVFRDGVRRYIRRHAESNTVAADLWTALSEASGQDVEPVVRAWIERPGFPLVKLERTGNTLRYRQTRFHASAPKRKSKHPASPAWPIPFVARVATRSGSRTERELLTRKSGKIELGRGAPGFVYGNAEESGFFRPLHAPEELRAIAKGRGRLAPVERLGLLEHQWAIVRAGEAPIETFLDLALAFNDEDDPDVLATLPGALASCARSAGRTLGEDSERAFRTRIAASFGPAFREMGWKASRSESDQTRMRRAQLLALVGRVGEDAETLASAERHCATYLLKRSSLEPNLAGDVVALAARDGDAALYGRFLAESKRAKTPQEERRLLFATAAFRDPALIDRTLEMALTDAVGTQDVAMLLMRLLGNPEAAVPTWTFIKARWKKLQKRLPPMLVTRPIEALPGLGTRAWRQDVARFFRAHPVATGQRTIRQALERFDAGILFDERNAKPLRRWLG
jgi:puromycin-sensitive aminopeptidase